MIQSPEGVDRGRFLFEKYPGAITDLVKSQKKRYFEHPLTKALHHNCRKMDLFIDNESDSVGSFISDITPPTIRRAYNEFTALFHKFLESDPLFDLTKNNTMKTEQLKAIQAIVNDGMRKTYFRDRCLLWLIDDSIRYGTFVAYNFADDAHDANSLMTVKSGDDSGGYTTYDQERIGSGTGTDVVSTPVHPMNAIVDPRSSFQSEPSYMGFLGDISISALKTLYDNPAYIPKNVKEAIKAAKKGCQDKDWYNGEDSELKDYSKGHATIQYQWTMLPFEGNEDDPFWYPIEMVNDKIVRIEENNLDENTIPMALGRIFPRKYTWAGNSPLVDKVCIQNLQYWLINATVESTARMMDRIVLYRKGSLDVTAINQRHQVGGLVPYEGEQQDLTKLMHGVQLPSVGSRENDWLMQEMRREDQETSMIPNFNPQAQGGPTNKTLGGAQMMASIGEMKASFLVNQFCVGLKDIAKQRMVIHRNIEEEKIQTTDGSEYTKDVLLGENISFYVNTSNVLNYVIDSEAAENRLQLLINRRATKIPQFQAVRMGPFIKDALRNSLKQENVEDYINQELLDAMDDRDEQMAEEALNPAPQAPPMPGPVGPEPQIPTAPEPGDMEGGGDVFQP